MFAFFRRVSLKKFAKDLIYKISENEVVNGAATIAFFLTMAVFPAAIFLLSLLPYLPIEHLKETVFHFIGQGVPTDTSQVFTGIAEKTISQRNARLLFSSLLFAIWSASSGMYAVIEQLNTTYDVKEGRPFWKARGIALLLTLVFVVLVIGAFILILLGAVIQEWPASLVGGSQSLLVFFALFRWSIIILFLLLALSCIYYFGPDVDQKFLFVSPGSITGVIILVGVSILFKLYVNKFGTFNATYGNMGVIIVLMMWLYSAGWVILLGSEMNALIEHYEKPEKTTGKDKREKEERPDGLRRLSKESDT